MATKRALTTAQKKQALVEVLLYRMQMEDFDEIKISDLCRDAQVSEASFYNYFPQKTDVLVYFILLWTVEIGWKLRYENHIDGLLEIEQFFRELAQSIAEQPSLIAEIIAFQIKWTPSGKWPQLSEADKLVAYPEYEKIFSIEAEGLDKMLMPSLQEAVARGEIPESTPLSVIASGICSLFFGIPMLVKQVPREQLHDIFLEQLRLLWDGARKRYGGVDWRKLRKD